MIAWLGLGPHCTSGRVAESFVAREIPGGTVHARRVHHGGSFGSALIMTSVWGRVLPDAFEWMENEALRQAFPQAVPLSAVFAPA